jgi:aspartyl-tRNA(Asn)/glutamyl-tRNA(Gln) amidotransferase subunit C
MAITREQVLHVAKLSRIEVSETDIEKLSTDMAKIVELVEKINEVDTTNVEPLSNVQELESVMRDDIAGAMLPIDTIKKLAPKFESGHIVVPAVIE